MQTIMFTHHETYPFFVRQGSGRRSATSILLEAVRDPHSCSHISEPKEPILLFGVSPIELNKQLKFIQLNAKNLRGKKFKRGEQLLGASVSSLNLSPTPENIARPDVQSWIQRNHNFYKEKFGACYKSLILHTDESKIHLHAFHIPILDENTMIADADALHPGYMAQKALKKSASRTEKNKAYNNAMRDFQNDYYESVGAPTGLLRFGPKRRRLTRAEWLTEKNYAAVLQNILLNLESQNVKLTNNFKKVINYISLTKKYKNKVKYNYESTPSNT
ncbi:hypothetical protein ACOCGN_001718 [Vibrio cholerae]